MAKILVADDNTGLRDVLVETLASLGHSVQGAADGTSAKTALLGEEWDLLLTDLRMPGVDGLSLCKEIQNRWEELPVVVITAHGSVQTAVESMQNGASDFLLKPTSPDALRVVIERVAARTVLTTRIPRSASQLHTRAPGRSASIGTSPSGVATAVPASTQVKCRYSRRANSRPLGESNNSSTRMR